MLWTSGRETGWFMAPRTLPLIMTLLRMKSLSGKLDPSKVYLELLARNIDNGIVEMGHEADHSFAAGYSSNRSNRSWQDMMKVLEDLGFIKAELVGTRYKYVLLIHPTTAIQKLREAGRIPDNWWKAYRDRQSEAGEATYEERTGTAPTDNVIQMSSGQR